MAGMPSTILGGMPHRLSKTDQYEGYTIPANAGVMINVNTIQTMSQELHAFVIFNKAVLTMKQ